MRVTPPLGLKKGHLVAGQATPRRRQQTLGHRPQLDGLRALAFLTVFIGHAGVTNTPGVARDAMFLFFGLSGFLISALLADEASRSGRVSLRKFFARRGLRLIPALVVFLGAFLLAVAVLGNEPWMTTVPGSTGGGGPQSFDGALFGAGISVLYVANWVDIFNGLGGHLALGHLWSLAVEEQFYVFFAPLLAVLLVYRRRFAVPVMAVLAAASVGGTVYLQQVGEINWNYMGTGCRAGAFLVGAAFALSWRSGGLSFLRHRFLGTSVAAGCLSALILLARSLVYPDSIGQFAISWAIATVAGPLLVVTMVQQTGGLAHRLFTHRVAIYIGKRSYALYLWHYVFLTWFNDLGDVGVAVAFVASFAAAELSWRFVESPALRMKERFSSSAGTKVAPATPPLLRLEPAVCSAEPRLSLRPSPPAR